jgi:hypothetical protein
MASAGKPEGVGKKILDAFMKPTVKALEISNKAVNPAIPHMNVADPLRKAMRPLSEFQGPPKPPPIKWL